MTRLPETFSATPTSVAPTQSYATPADIRPPEQAPVITDGDQVDDGTRALRELVRDIEQGARPRPPALPPNAPSGVRTPSSGPERRLIPRGSPQRERAMAELERQRQRIEGNGLPAPSPTPRDRSPGESGIRPAQRDRSIGGLDIRPAQRDRSPEGPDIRPAQLERQPQGPQLLKNG